jgi:hypothetical protein
LKLGDRIEASPGRRTGYVERNRFEERWGDFDFFDKVGHPLE